MASVGDKIPEATFFELTAEGPSKVTTTDLFAGKTVALFGVPGAFTPTCHNAHLPSFVAAAADLKSKGVDEIVCVSVNDAFVMGKWGEVSGASEAGIRMMGDPTAAFVTELGTSFDGGAVGLGTRAMRFSALVKDGEIAVFNVEDKPSDAISTLGEALVAAI